MTAEMCRVSIRSAHRDTDLALPADLPLCEVIPSVVDVVGAEVCGRDVHLVRADGDVLDAARSLAQCGVHDGEVLILTAATEPPHRAPFDLCDSVVDAVGRTDSDVPARHPTTAVVGTLWSAAAVAVVLGHNAFDATTGNVGAGCATAISALVGAVVLRRDPPLAVPLGVVAAALAGLSAALAVPALPGFMLAMSAVSATSLLAWRLLDCGTGTFLPLGGMTMAAAAAAFAEHLGLLPTAGIGPVLTMASLAVLAVAPRLATRLSGLSASVWPDDVERRAASARRVLTGLVTAAAATSALGTLVTAVLSVRRLEAATLIAAVAAILLLRSRTHADPCRAAALLISAGVAVSVFVGLVAVSAPWTTTWLCGLLIAGAVIVMVLGSTDLSVSPAAEQMMAAVEWAAGAAIVPLACATAGFFTAIRSLA
jgi:type VII secretion integral membrane protein EccD